jgi:hypothetical protein
VFAVKPGITIAAVETAATFIKFLLEQCRLIIVILN